MRKAKIKDLTLENFKEYGYFADMINPDATCIGEEPIQFYRDMLPFNTDNTNITFSVCRVIDRKKVVDITEYHTSTPEGILPLDGDVVMHVGIATPEGEVPLNDMEIFRVPQGTMVVLRPGVWHHAIFADGCECVNTLIVLPERTYANDCIVVELEEEEQIEIVE